MANHLELPYRDAMVQDVIRAFGRPEEFIEGRFLWSPERMRAVQEERLRKELQRAWDVPFYRRHWEESGFEPSQFKSLDDLSKIPAYTIDHIRESLVRCPPYGDYQGVIPGEGRSGLRMYTSGGTSGKPRPTIYTAWDRLAGSLMIARSLHLQGFRRGDIVLNAWSYGTHNAAWAFDDALWYWIGCMPITVGTGNVTSSVKQLEMALEYKASSILTSADYLLHLKKVADQEGLKREDFNFRQFQTIGDVKAVSDAWSVPAYDSYAFHEVQTVAAECPEHQGLHVWDDAFIVEIVDPETGDALPDGEYGDLVITCLYKTGSPQIRFNVKDTTRMLTGKCACGSESKRIDHLSGRSDSMVKLRGINVWPEAIGNILSEVGGEHVEYFCVAYRDGGRDQMLVLCERPSTAASTDTDALRGRFERLVSSRLGVNINVRIREEGALSELTGRGQSGKLRRFLDERGSATPEVSGYFL